MAPTLNHRSLARVRHANRRSAPKSARAGGRRTSRHFSLTWSRPPDVNRICRRTSASDCPARTPSATSRSMWSRSSASSSGSSARRSETPGRPCSAVCCRPHDYRSVSCLIKTCVRENAGLTFPSSKRMATGYRFLITSIALIHSCELSFLTLRTSSQHSRWKLSSRGLKYFRLEVLYEIGSRVFDWHFFCSASLLRFLRSSNFALV